MEAMSEIAPDFYCGRAPEFWGLGYQMELTFDHVAKLHGDRSRELKKCCSGKKDLGGFWLFFNGSKSWNYCSGRPKQFVDIV